MEEEEGRQEREGGGWGRGTQMVLETKAGMESGVIGAGHRFAAKRLDGQRSTAGWLSEQMGGIAYLDFIRDLAKRVDSDWDSVQVWAAAGCSPLSSCRRREKETKRKGKVIEEKRKRRGKRKKRREKEEERKEGSRPLPPLLHYISLLQRHARCLPSSTP